MDCKYTANCGIYDRMAANETGMIIKFYRRSASSESAV